MSMYIVSEKCIACGACWAECPVSATVEIGHSFKIDELKCLDCGACAAVCPISIIYYDRRTAYLELKRELTDIREEIKISKGELDIIGKSEEVASKLIYNNLKSMTVKLNSIEEALVNVGLKI